MTHKGHSPTYVLRLKPPSHDTICGGGNSRRHRAHPSGSTVLSDIVQRKDLARSAGAVAVEVLASVLARMTVCMTVRRTGSPVRVHYGAYHSRTLPSLRPTNQNSLRNRLSLYPLRKPSKSFTERRNWTADAPFTSVSLVP
jgi:hypothetical protein